MLDLRPHAAFTSSCLPPPTCPLPLHALHTPQVPCPLLHCLTVMLQFPSGFWVHPRVRADSAAIPNGSNICRVLTMQGTSMGRSSHPPCSTRHPPPPLCTWRHTAAMNPFHNNIRQNCKLAHGITECIPSGALVYPYAFNSSVHMFTLALQHFNTTMAYL